MKRCFSLPLAFILAAQTVPALAADPCPVAESDHDGYLVALAESADPSRAEAAGCEAVSDTLYYADAIWNVGALSLLCEVDYWTTNDILTTQDCYEGYETSLWNLCSVEASAGWNHLDQDGRRDRLGDDITVAVVDSGVMADHPDLADAHILDYVALSSETDGVDDYHGTFVTGLLAAEVNNGIGVDGIVPNVNILPICITWSGGKTDVKTAVAGIDKAVELGADIITFSIGGTNDNEALRQACEAAAESGVILVTCAGNYSAGRAKSDQNYMYPAAYDCVVTVSACKQEGAGVVFDSDYSYFNDGVTVSAPGTDITSLYLDGNTATRTGTSFAAPVVTAMAVMAKQADRTMDTEGFVELLKTSSVDLGEEGFDPCYGHGYVNIPAFLAALDTAAEPDPDPTTEPAEADDPAPGEDPTESDQPAVPAPGEEPARPEGPDTPPSSSDPSGPSGGGTVPSAPPAGSEEDPTPQPTDPADGPLPPEPDSPDYTDIPAGAWFYDSVRWATAQGIMNGTGEGIFSPNSDTSRAMMVTILWRMAGEPGSEISLSFQDIPAGTWYTEAVRWAAETHIVDGYSAEEFGPSDPVTREQLAVILYRYAASRSMDTTGGLADLTGYHDADTISPWALDALRKAVGTGLMDGTGDGTLRPRAKASRAQAATILMRFSEHFDNTIP